MKKTFIAFTLSLLLVGGSFAQTQKPAKAAKKQAKAAKKMDHSTMKMADQSDRSKSGKMQGMDHSKMDHSKMDHSKMKMKKDS